MSCYRLPVHNQRGEAWRRCRAGLFLATLALSAITAGPLRADLFTPSVQDQIKLGDQAAAQVMRQYRVVQDDRSRQVEQVGRRLLNALTPKDRGPWEYRFHLIDSKEINAFALPGGNVFVFTGLYDRLQTEDELAALMGHELTHIRAQHWAHMAGEQAKREAALGVLLGLARAGRVWQNVAGITNTLLSLRYSRKEEDQADAGGLQDMLAADYNPQGMLDLFHTLVKAAGQHEGPAFLTDHPLTSQRIERTQERIKRLGTGSFRPQVPLQGKDHP
jgi:predicted Zn-dependent protease